MEVSTTAEAIQPAEMPRPQLVRLVLVLGAMTAFGAMSIDMYLPAFPSIAHDLHVPLGTIQLTISAFLFGSAVGQLFYGHWRIDWEAQATPHRAGTVRCFSSGMRQRPIC